MELRYRSLLLYFPSCHVVDKVLTRRRERRIKSIQNGGVGGGYIYIFRRAQDVEGRTHDDDDDGMKEE